ncbi:MAG: hypothetical protein IPL79_15155 [Myxococcales bacterium]|nr:hypothetical protein [Myxococcales bacterium]
MNWLTRIFGRHAAPAPAPATSASAPREASDDLYAARARRNFAEQLAGTFCRGMPGATLERFGAAERDDHLLARVTYHHQGVVSRLVLYAEDDGLHSSVFVETRCKGVFGTLTLFRAAAGETFDDDTPRVFLAPTTYATGPRIVNEIARLRMLPEEMQARLFALAGRVERVALADEVIVAHLGDLDKLAEVLRSPTQTQRQVLGVGNELAAIAASWLAISHDEAQVIEARVCVFCGAAFVFAPSGPRCTRCGGTANNARPMPPPQHIEIPDDPLLAPDEAALAGPAMAANRVLAYALCQLASGAEMTDEAARGRLFVTYTLDGRSFRAKFKDAYVGVRTAVAGARGDFFLAWSHQDVTGTINAGEAWRETERKIFFSKHCRVRSDHTAKEAARLASLPAPALRMLTEMCEAYESNASLEAGFLAQGMGGVAHRRGAEAIIECSQTLAAIADALPRDYPDVDALRYQVAACRHCGWEYFIDQARRACTHCGGAAA